MTITYDPFHPKYFDERDLRDELTRVYDLCHGCRLCFKFCTSFPTLFDYIDRHDDQDAAKLTPAQQDQVVDECFQCKLCYVNCPYIPGQHEWAIDFPKLMMRAEQVLFQNRTRDLREKVTDNALARTDLVGKANTSSVTAPIANAVAAKPNSKARKLMEKVTGISAQRVLPPYAKQRFSSWFRRRGSGALGKPKQGNAALFPTCLVEYQEVGIGHDMVKVLERNGVSCSLPHGQRCCGAPHLHQGDVESFREQATQNVAVLADAIRKGDADGDPVTVVVPQPTCSLLLKQEYPEYLGTADARLVASRTKDLSEYLVELHRGTDTALDTEFTGEVPATLTYHAPCHLRRQNIGYKSRDLLKLTGTKINVVAECSGIDGTWGLRAENLDIARGVAKKMADAITKADADVVAGDCALANGAIVLETGKVPVHPIQAFARAYGIAEEPEAVRQRQQKKEAGDIARRGVSAAARAPHPPIVRDLTTEEQP